MLETIVVLGLIVPAALSIGVAWLFIRRGRATVGIFSGLGFIVLLPIIGIALINRDIASCVLRCEQENASACGICGEWSGVLIGALLIGALADGVVFLLVGLSIARRYRAGFVWPSWFLIATGVGAMLVSLINYIEIRPHFEALPVSANAIKYYASFVGLGLGLCLILLAINRARKIERRPDHLP